MIRIDHAVVVAEFPEYDVFGTHFSIHQWSRSDNGVVRRSSTIGTCKLENEEQGKVWAASAATEIGNWGVFLPTLYNLYRVVTDVRRNPYPDLSIDGVGRDARSCCVR